MGIKPMHKYLHTIIFITGLCIQWTNSGTGDPYSSQPRLIIQNGHLVFQTAQNHNISFVSTQGGYIRINNDDLVHVVEEAKSTTANIQQFGIANLETLNQRVNRLQSQFDEISNFANRLSELETNYTRIASRVNDQQRTLNSLNRRSIRQRLQALENSVNELNTALQENNCLSNPCQHGATCIDAYRDYICQCTPGWQGKSCSEDVNECQDFVGTNLGCKNGATCINTVGSYSCNCPPNWFGAHCNEQHDDCNSASHQELCGHGTCINENNGGRRGQPNYRCICDEGWTTGPGSPACVVDEDECTGNQYSCSRNPPVSCINAPGTFHCGPCPSGYTGNGHFCNDINECATNNGGCSITPMVECINTIGSRICGSCPRGYQGDGIHCNFVNVCNINNGGCHPQATCVMGRGAFRECHCPNGFSGSGIGPNGCSPSVGTACETNPCVHGSCQVIGNNYRCICSPGYTGVNCESTLNACYSNPCRNGGTCTSVADGFSCSCTSNWQGITCEDIVQSCGGQFNDETGSLKYPSDETSQYPHGVSCNWVIRTANPSKVLNLTFTSFDIEANYPCTFDFLQINDGPYVTSRLIGRFCGNTPPRGGSLITTHSSVYLWFKSDDSVAGDGFQLTWTSVDPVCGGDLMSTDQGTIRSPGYPHDYPHNRDCYWRVEVSLQKRIKFIFSDFNIEHHVNCSFDFLQIYDGLSENDPVLRTYCGTETTLPSVTTSGPSALVYFHTDESMSAPGFLITYISEARVHGCGGLLTNADGHFSSPHFPNAYVNNLRCEWLIRLPPRERIELNFTTFDVEGHLSCRYDYVEVIDGEHEGDPIIGRYCNNIRPPVISSLSNKLRIILSTDSSVVHNGFIANYTTACGGTFTGISGELYSPNYPDRYPDSKTCYYLIIVPPGNIIEVNFIYFDIEESGGPNDCYYDYLEIRDVSETGLLLGKLCGMYLPGTVRSSLNQLWLKFVSDGSVRNYGFLLNYTSTEIGCGGVMTDRHGIIASPNILTEQGFLTCNWLLRADAGFVVKLNFLHVNLRSTDDCSAEYIDVFDTNGQKIKRFCGQEMPPMLRSSDNEMKITFRTMYQTLPEGFSASYIFVDSTQDCGGDFYTQSGEVKSPGYPNYYPHRRDCTWVLHTDGNKQISVYVLAFHLENHSACNYDYLEIRNGGYSTSPLVGKFCGNNGPSNFTSHGHTLWLHFVSDHSMSAPGFRIFYESTVEGCGGVVTSQEGSIVSPGFPDPYHHNAECNWLIQVALGSVIKFFLRDVDIEAHATCDYDFLQIYDGDSERAPTIIKICGQRQNTEHYVSTSNKLYIKFRTDYSSTGRGFHLMYEIDCNTVLKGHRGIIESPNFPSPYSHLLNCTWMITAPIGNNVSIAFSHMVMEYSSDCSYDSLEIAETSSLSNTERQIVKYCGGDEIGEPILTSQNIAIVRFITDHSISYDGFRLEWQVQGCGGELKRDSGVIQSPNYPNSYPLTVECLWYVTVSPGKKIEFTIERMHLEKSHDCMYDYVKVYGGEDETSPQIGAYCNAFDRSQTVTTHGNRMTVHFYSDYSYAGMGFYATYHSVEGGCGGRFTANSGTLTSPNYNGNFDANDDCIWNINVDKNHLIQLRVEDFDISPASVNCSSSYLAIYDGDNEGEELLLQHCGSNIPDPAIYRSTSNNLFLRMKADGIHSSRGFKISYETACGATINADEGGEIMSLNYPHTMQTIEECTWILYLTDLGEKITIVVTDLSTPEVFNINCTYQYVKIRSGRDSNSPLLQQFCGNVLPPPIMSPGNVVRVSFRGNRFRATYGTSRNTCGGTMVAEHGTFTSPDYPNSYPINIECVWNVSAAAGNKIQLSFSAFSIEESDYCNTDYLEIREDDDSGRLLGKYCGTNFPNNITRISGRFWIKFRSDERGTGQGFIASYSLIHGVELNGTEGFIESPSYPHYTHREEVFTWIITVPTSMFVRIEFLHIDLEEPTYGSCSSYVMVIDGANQYGLELRRYCTRTIPDPVVTTNNVATIKFYNKHIPGRWRLKWGAVIDPGNPINPSIPPSANICWENLFVNETNTTIQSPGYPYSYDNDMNCTWIINAGEHRHVKLDILDLNIEGWMDSCYYDRLLLFDAVYEGDMSWNEIGKVCGRIYSPVSFDSSTNIMKLTFTTDGAFTHTGFKAVARSECGGKFFSPRGVLNTSDASPSYGRPPCEWVIAVRPGRTIRLYFDEFNIPDDSSCSHQYMLFRNGGEATSPLLGDGKYCNNNRPHTLESLSHEVFIQLNSQYNYHSQQQTPIFKVRYEEVSVGCGGQFSLSNSNPSLVITSPNHPNPPPHDTECQWVVMGPPNSRLRLDFNERMDIESGCRADNSTEFVEVRDGGTVNSEVIRRYCGQYQPSSAFSTGNIMSIRYVTSARQPHSGFNITVLIAKCGGIIIAYNTTVSSPNYPLNYDNNMECEWTVTTWHFYILKIYFEDMAIVDDGFCNNDYVYLSEGSSSGPYLTKQCGMTNISDVFQSEAHSVYLKFKTNATGTGRGFLMRFVAELPDCGGELRSPSGVIESPGFPYSTNLRRACNWKISVEEGRIITFTFSHFNLRQDPVNHTCINKLLLWNGTDDIWNINDKMWSCGNRIPAPVDSIDNTASLFYYSFGNLGGEGFRLTYTSDKAPVCGGKLSSANGTFSSPGFENGTNSNFFHCIWRLRNEGDFSATLVVQFDVLDLPTNSTQNCVRDYLVIQKGDIATLNFNSRRICGNFTRQNLFVSTPRNGLLVALIKNSSEPFIGFNASYSTQECGGEIEIGTEGKSPHFPNNYPQNTVCHWRIDAEVGIQIKLTFVEFELESDCSKDYVEIRNGERYDSPVTGRYCGSQLPNEITSQSNHLTILFHSDSSGSAKGFRFTTISVHRGCGGIIKSSESFSSPVVEGSSLYPNNAECIWLLESDSDYHHNLTFINRYDIEMEQNCNNDYLQVDEYENHTWKFMHKYCGNTRPAPIISSSNHVRVMFRSNEQVQADGFTVLHSIVCGRKFLMEDAGVISSPGFPGNYPDNLNCEYLIQNTPDAHITLQFDQRFYIEEHSSCEYDSLIVYAGNSTSSHQIGNFCGFSVPDPLTSKGAMLLVFKTDWVVSKIGFMATFSVSKCGGHLTGPEGTFATPNIALGYVSSMNCTWVITVEPNRVIQLRFLSFDLGRNPCYQSYVNIYDWHHINYRRLKERICGDDPKPQTLKSNGQNLTVYYWASRSSFPTGFHATYRTTFGPNQGCGGSLSNQSGEISLFDVNGDGNYESQLDCVWNIFQPGKLVHITFLFMDIESEPSNNGSCPYDYLEIRDGTTLHDPIIGKFCGTQLPKDIISNAGRVTLHFHSDYLNERRGFRISYAGEEPTCGGSVFVTDVPQTLTSINYPNPYEPNLHCQWQFYHNNSARYVYDPIELTFHDMDIPCGGDRIEIRQDGMDQRPLQFCGQHIIHHFRALIGVKLNFVTDMEGAGRGFSLSYSTAGCNRNYTHDNAVIYSPKYPYDFYTATDCNFTIHTEEGRTIALYFNSFRASYRSLSCRSRGMKIHEGIDSSGPVIGTFCNSLPNPVFSHSNAVFIQLKARSYIGYSISYTTTNQGRGCGGNLTSINGTFTSPLYPFPCNISTQCRWYITVPGEHTLTLDFPIFELNSTRGCETNYVEIYESHNELNSNRVGRYCGGDRPASHSSQGNTVLVKLVTSTNNNASGFKATFHTNSLGGSLGIMPSIEDRF